ncbi:MAG: hypothetical protein AAFZ15_33905 [Bacteroidota bacterium]
MKAKPPSKKVMWGNTITNIHANVLLGLARYQYLTFSQMLQLGVGTKHYQYLWKQVVSLRDRRRPLVKCHNFSTPQPKRGRVESLYFLTAQGKNALINELNIHEEFIKKPTSKTVAYKDYHHRKQTIDFRIHLDKWAKEYGYEVPFFDTYFEKSKHPNGLFYAKTRIDLNNGYIIPDGAFKVANFEIERFYLFELHRGEDSSRIIQQIHRHAQCLTSRATHGKYNLPLNKAYRVLLLFENEGVKESVLKRIKKEQAAFKNIQQYFLLKGINNSSKGEFDKNWITLYSKDTEII